MWTGPVVMGERQVEMNVVYDTGSDWLVVFGKDCTNCNGTKFDSRNGIPTTSSVSERNYGSASLTGREFRDSVCIDFRTCARDFEYFSILTQQGLNPPIEGILGMSQNSSSAMEGRAFVEVGPLFVEHAVRDGTLRVPTFSFCMKTLKGGKSHVDFGRPDDFFVKGGNLDNVAWLGT